MTIPTIWALAIIGSVVAWAIIFGGRAPRGYRDRSCQGRAWRRQFPDSSRHQILAFLSTFAQGFAFRDREKLKFRPDDELSQVYRAIYPAPGWPDALEFEALAMLIAKRYGVALADVWRDNLTLGQLYKLTWRGNDA